MKTKRAEKQKGITLIALVITIIVLLILAGVAVNMLSGENGILKQAAKAKTETEEKSTVEAMKLAGITALTAGNGSVNDNYCTALNKELKDLDYDGTISKGDLPVEDIVVKGLHFAIKENGEVVNLAWWYEKDAEGNTTDVITDGTQKLTLGDTVNYNPIEGLTADATTKEYAKYESKVERNGYGSASQTFSIKNNKEGKQKLTWKVLGTDEDGNVLIMPTECIKKEDGTIQYLYLGKYRTTDFTGGQAAAQYGAEEVNNVAEIYGHGKGAKGARSVTEEDIAKIVKPTLSTATNIYDYGNKVTYKKNDSGKIEYSWYKNVSGELKQQTETSDYENFTYLEGNIWKPLNAGQSVTLTSTYKSYSISEAKCKNANLYNLLTKDTGNNQYYWLGSSCVNADSGGARFGVRYVDGYGVSYYSFFDSYGYAYGGSFGVRPAVSLKSDIKFGGDATSGWTIQ